MGMTREQMAETLSRQGVKAISIAGDTFSDESLRTLLKKALGDDGQFVLANYYRAALDRSAEDTGRHWRPMTSSPTAC